MREWVTGSWLKTEREEGEAARARGVAVAGGSWNSYEERTEKWEAMHPSSVRPPSPSPSFFHVRIPSGDFGEKERKKD